MSESSLMVERLRAELARLLDVKELNLKSTVSGMGWDSMMLVELAIAAEVVYDRRINLEKLDIDFGMTLEEIFSRVDALMNESVNMQPARSV